VSSVRARTICSTAAIVTGFALALSATGRADESARFSEVHLSGVGNVSRWAYVLQDVTARELPGSAARPVGLVRAVTPEGETNLVVADAARRDRTGRLWIRVPLARLPNGLTGWIPRGALGDLHVVRTHLVIDRARFTATLLRNGRVVFRTAVGVGRPRWPTPSGNFYVRVRLDHFTDPMYGPVAFGTNARSPRMTDWPEGGFVGIHGTDHPQLLPGRVSHGCIRLRNSAILRLARLMPLGTPVSIR
jgi:lipoprotein-anchoring transpeptidase ErfK/SrfK